MSAQASARRRRSPGALFNIFMVDWLTDCKQALRQREFNDSLTKPNKIEEKLASQGFLNLSQNG